MRVPETELAVEGEAPEISAGNATGQGSSIRSVRKRDGCGSAAVLEHDEFRLSRNDIGGGLPLPLGEGWGEGLRSLVRAEALTRFAAQIDLSPPGRGEPTSRQVESIKSHTAMVGKDRRALTP